MRNVSDNVGERVMLIFLYESLAIYEIFWKNGGRVRQITDGNAIRRKRWHADD